jgi:aminoglycoside phosphotransferase (APT) family kinase protein
MTRATDGGAEAVRAVLARHLPDRRVDTVTPLGAGLDNTAYDVDGAFVVRLNRLADTAERSAQVRREARLLSTVAARSPVPVPEPVVIAEDDGCLVYPRLPGRPLLDVPAPRLAAHAVGIGAALGRLLTALQAIPAAEAAEVADVDDTPLDEWLAEARLLAAELDGAIPAAHRPAVEAFLDAAPPPPSERLTLSHNDLGIEHVLVDEETGRITGIIDWTDAAITDPARDLGLILRDLGPAALDAALAADGGAAPARERIGFLARCALLEDLAHGLAGGGAAYVEKSVRGMRWLFPA